MAKCVCCHQFWYPIHEMPFFFWLIQYKVIFVRDGFNFFSEKSKQWTEIKCYMNFFFCGKSATDTVTSLSIWIEYCSEWVYINLSRLYLLWCLIHYSFFCIVWLCTSSFCTFSSLLKSSSFCFMFGIWLHAAPGISSWSWSTRNSFWSTTISSGMTLCLLVKCWCFNLLKFSCFLQNCNSVK